MAHRIVVYWRDIPAQIVVRSGRAKATRELPGRFLQAIDRCAMRSGATDTDAYLSEWRRGEPVACGDDLEAEAEAGLAAIDSKYSNDTLRALVSNDGWATGQCLPSRGKDPAS